MRENGSPSGFQVHSTMLVDADNRELIGLIDQQRWLRDPIDVRKQSGHRRKKEYQMKESRKWAEAFQNTTQRLGESTKTITICDREADIFEFMKLFRSANTGFVIRLAHNRALADGEAHLHETIASFPQLGVSEVSIGQRGSQSGRTPGQQRRESRKARVARVAVKSGSVTLRAPRNGRTDKGETVSVNIVHIHETKAPDGETPVEWMLFTSEPISEFAQALSVVKMYSTRWLIEEFHKAWKSGCRIEHRNLQSFENLERMMAITAPIAIRILQLREIVNTDPTTSCEAALDQAQWQYLWITIERQPLPSDPPDIRWAYNALARLAGWTDSKRTGKVGWQTLWLGWQKMQEQLIGWQCAMAAIKVIGS
jgi:hypothetical protein